MKNNYCQKNLWERYPFYNVSKVLIKLYYVSNSFDVEIFDKETTLFLNILKFAWELILFLYFF